MTIKNKKAYYLYEILEEMTAGICLLGSEVKSIREGNVSLVDCFAYIKEGEVFIKNMKVGRYKQVHIIEKYDDNREKKALLKRKEINKITRYFQDKGITMIPLEVFFSHNKIKVKLGVCRGKKLWNKKESIKSKDLDRQTKRDLVHA